MFERGDLVNIYDSGGNRLGSGIVNYGSDDLKLIKGLNSNKIAGILGHDYGPEIVHKNNMVVL